MRTGNTPNPSQYIQQSETTSSDRFLAPPGRVTRRRRATVWKAGGPTSRASMVPTSAESRRNVQRRSGGGGAAFLERGLESYLDLSFLILGAPLHPRTMLCNISARSPPLPHPPGWSRAATALTSRPTLPSGVQRSCLATLPFREGARVLHTACYAGGKASASRHFRLPSP